MTVAVPLQLSGGVVFALEVALGAEEGGANVAIWAPDANQALWDTEGEWSGLTPSWVDVTDDAEGLTTARGRDRWEQQFRVGTCIARVDNQGGQYNPDRPVVPGALKLRPGRWLRVLGRRTDDGSEWVPLWTGQIDAMEDIYTSAAHGIDSVFTSLDFGARFQIDDPPALDTPIPPGELTSDRVTRVLNEAGWPDYFRDIEPGLHTMAESSLAGSRWVEMQAAATAEGGSMFMGADGVPTFRNRDWLSDKIGGPAKFTVGAVASNVQIIDADNDWSQQRIYGDVRMSRKGGTEYRVESPESVSLYGRRTYQRYDIECENDTQLITIADRFLASHEFDRSRLESVRLVPINPDGITELLNVALGDLIRVTVRTQGDDSWAYTDDYFVQKVTHQIDASDWVTVLRIDAATFETPLNPASYTDGYDDGYDSQDPS